ncbi:hypothetical protein SAMN04488128_104169 [Chitinophaga eiseniae]|uniref:Uncharacterized protein n=1 Tax=Chitinophaga eiseniae TaxID=634771 RepID=A0A1T4T8I2_9BACT|nr:hypothetical protein [Chitinophaga eiseniae]SKA36785.1 hypothetical protein SAMN04488128_104169 [Chitinophaga eiseniae]
MVCAVAACSKSGNDTDDNSDPADLNSISITVEGDVNRQIESRGQDVNVGLLKFTKTTLEGFGVGSIVIDDNTDAKTAVNTGLMEVSLQEKGEQKGTATGSLTAENGNGHMDYSGMSYFVFYDTDPEQNNSKTYLTLTEVKDTAHWLKLTGRFRYNAAYGPSPLSEPCIKEGLANAGRIPMYNPDLCGAKKVKVSGNFTIYLDKVMQR